ncbi:MAG: electron transfer flavoprotein subunit alpha/FixB family protein [Anaerotignaceae bacterium]
MKKILIYIDEIELKNAIDLFGVVEKVYKGEQVETYGVCLGEKSVEFFLNKDFTFLIDGSMWNINPWEVEKITDALEELNEEFNFEMILFPATVMGRNIAPRLAMGLNTGLVADVTDVFVEDEEIVMVRPAFDGKILACIKNNTYPVMMSVRHGVFSYVVKGEKEKEIITFPLKKQNNYTVYLLGEKEKPMLKDIRKSPVLISGGGGVKNSFKELQTLADKLGGMVSASRSIVDSGIARRNIQVGQSGKTVSPELYIALGIFGSLQHVEGLKNVETIISVNTDRYAPICSLSELVVEGDAQEFVQKLVERIEKN